MFESLKKKLQDSYEMGITMDEAEKLAGEFLVAQMEIAEKLKVVDLDARMKKSGLKTIKASVYLKICGEHEKKPSDSFIQAKVDADETVLTSQDLYDSAEVLREDLLYHMSIFKEAHIHFRGIAKGRYE